MVKLYIKLKETKKYEKSGFICNRYGWAINH